MALNFRSSIHVSVHINASPGKVWHDLSDIASHVEWMEDAKTIAFNGTKRRGIGTSFRCETQIWKFTVEDELLITEWADERRMGVQHDGIVKGNGTFTLAGDTSSGTTFSWEEQLLFPVHFGGPFGEYVARPILTRVWQTNLSSLKQRVEADHIVNPIRFFAERGVELHTRRKRGQFSVDLVAPNISDFNVANYAGGVNPFEARAAALHRWVTEEEPTADF